MASFAAFAAGYLARPIGGIVLSHYGDRYGRRAGVPVVGVRHVGRHARHGTGADVRAVGRRGQRADGRAAIDAGVLPRRRAARRADLRRRDGAADRAVRLRRRVRVRHDGRGRGDRRQPVGAHVAAIRRWCLRYGWRIAFVLGGLGGVLSFVLRRSLEESPEFARMRSLASRQPFRELLRTHTSARCWSAARCWPAPACFNGLFFSHLPAYLSAVLQYDPRQAVFSQTVGVIASALGILATGWLGDRIPPRYLLRAGRRAAAGARVSVLRALAGARHQSHAAAGRWPASPPD